jgi:hypothetical protein
MLNKWSKKGPHEKWRQVKKILDTKQNVKGTNPLEGAM